MKLFPGIFLKFLLQKPISIIDMITIMFIDQVLMHICNMNIWKNIIKKPT